jgi:hypothetical protein
MTQSTQLQPDSCACRPTASPCRMRPDTGEPCALLRHTKDNTICLNCGLIPGKGNIVKTNQEIKSAIDNGLLRPPTQIKIAIEKREPAFCQFPDCGKRLRKHTGKYCNLCGMTVSNRRKSWANRWGDDSEAPIEFLHLPVGKAIVYGYKVKIGWYDR